MIYILEGPDGVGKSTLAYEIAEQKKASVVHSYFQPDWDILQHHSDMFLAASIINGWRSVVLDRWAPSEFVYGTVFRGKPGYDVRQFLTQFTPDQVPVKYIYCRNDKAVENHLKMLEKRHEMFDDMTEVVGLFDNFVESTPELNWLTYDFDKVDRKKFVKELPNDSL
jgi:thymidylate kinase